MKKTTNQANFYQTGTSTTDPGNFIITTGSYIPPKTKVQIIQELLDKKQITAEEAVTLLLTEKEVVYLPQYPVSPNYPFGAPVYCEVANEPLRTYRPHGL